MDTFYVVNGVVVRRIQLTASTNPTVIFTGKAVVHGIFGNSTFSTGTNTTFVKLYDKATTPTFLDTPILTYKMPSTVADANVQYPQISGGLRRTLDYFCENGLSMRATAVADDTDNTSITITSGIRWVWIAYTEV